MGRECGPGVEGNTTRESGDVRGLYPGPAVVFLLGDIFVMFPLLIFFFFFFYPPEVNPTIGLQLLYENKLDLGTTHPIPT